MGAISTTLFVLLSPGDRVVSIKDTYGGTNKQVGRIRVGIPFKASMS
jgi:cystathionine beta-lyase/cystathionine gamma-synthase